MMFQAVLLFGVVSLQPFGRREGLTVSLSEGPLNVPVATWGSQNYWKNYVSDEFYELFHLNCWPTYQTHLNVHTVIFVEDYNRIV